MPATTSGAVKAVLEAAGLGVAVYRDGAPSTPDPVTGEPVPAVPMPYVTVREAIAVTPALDGPYDRDVKHNVREAVQVDVWQTWRDAGKVAEDYALGRAVAAALHGASLPPAPRRVYGCRVTGTTRLLEPQTNVVHDAITVTVDREA